MNEEEFIETVYREAPLESKDAARDVVAATMETLGERITDGEAEDIAQHLPMRYLSDMTSTTIASYIPLPDSLLWTFPFVAPAIVAYLIFLQDWRDGYRHHPAEYVAAFTLGPYLIVQTAVIVTAFIEEYLLRKPSIYVTTSRSG